MGCQNSKQRIPDQNAFRSSLIWACAISLGLFGKQLVFEISEELL